MNAETDLFPNVAKVLTVAELTRSIRGLLFGVGASDWISVAAAIAGLGAVAIFSAWIPARRAARVDPLIALRAE